MPEISEEGGVFKFKASKSTYQNLILILFSIMLVWQFLQHKYKTSNLSIVLQAVCVLHIASDGNT